MASFYLQGADELARELNKLAGEVDQISMKMVDEAADIMDKELSVKRHFLITSGDAVASN